MWEPLKRRLFIIRMSCSWQRSFIFHKGPPATIYSINKFQNDAGGTLYFSHVIIKSCLSHIPVDLYQQSYPSMRKRQQTGRTLELINAEQQQLGSNKKEQVYDMMDVDGMSREFWWTSTWLAYGSSMFIPWTHGCGWSQLSRLWILLRQYVATYTSSTARRWRKFQK